MRILVEKWEWVPEIRVEEASYHSRAPVNELSYVYAFRIALDSPQLDPKRGGDERLVQGWGWVSLHARTSLPFLICILYWGWGVFR